jgi:hypothetical protein
MDSLDRLQPMRAICHDCNERWILPMRKHVLVSVLAVALAAVAGNPTPAHAVHPNQLIGNWAVNSTGSCLTDPGGFNTKLQPLNPSESYVSRFSASGIITFNAPTSISRTGLITGTETRNRQVLGDATPASALNTGFVPSVSTTIYTNTVATYQIQTGSNVITGFVQDEIGSYTEGPRAGQTTTIDQYEWTGYVSADGKTIVTASPDNTVEHITYSGGGLAAPQTYARICHRASILTKTQ